MAKNKNKEPQYYLSRINTQVLNYGVYVMKPTEKLLYLLILFVAGGAVGLTFYGGLFKEDGKATMLTMISNTVVFVVIGLLAIKSFLPSITKSLQKKRADRLRKQFCDFASSLTNSLASGMNMNDSILAVYKDLQTQYAQDDYIVREVQEIINGMNNSIPIEDMLKDFGIRSGIPDILNFATVFATCYRTGGDIKSVVRRTSETISEKMMINSEIETTITSNKMQANIMTVLPIVIVLMMRFASSEFSAGFGTVIGVIGLTISAVLTFAAYKVGQKIMDIKG